jgi:GTPase SAR1 family protein
MLFDLMFFNTNSNRTNNYHLNHCQIIIHQDHMNNRYNATLKIMMLGDRSVGKTSLLERYVHDTFNNDYVSTIGIDIKQKTMETAWARGTETNNNNHYALKLQIWDMNGKDRFFDIIHRHYKYKNIFVVCYDSRVNTMNTLNRDENNNNNGSMYSVTKWLFNIMTYNFGNPDKFTKIYVVGTCMDNMNDDDVEKMYKRDDLKNCIKQWDTLYGAKFIGLLSSMNNKFHPYSNDSNSNSNKTILTIDNFFDSIAKLYIETDFQAISLKKEKKIHGIYSYCDYVQYRNCLFL